MIPNTTQESCVLNVRESASGRRWLWRCQEELKDEDLSRLVLDTSQEFHIPEIVARILIQRGYSKDEIPHFLDPKLKDLMPDPFTLKDMDKASERMAQAIKNKEIVGIFGDYDVDGISSSSILYNFFTHMGCQVVAHIPDRIEEGYGPNAQALQNLIDDQATLIICVDCGTSSADILTPLAKDEDIIVFDHHKAEGQIPKVLAVVNPQRADCDSNLTYLCATAVTFLSVVATCRRLCQDHIMSKEAVRQQLWQYLDLVALATVCDVMPLRYANRAFVKQGLAVMSKRHRLGLSALMDRAAMTKEPDAFSCGFKLGPRINSGGRIAQADLGFRLLTTKKPDDARYFSDLLDQVNNDRRDVEKNVLDDALERAQKQREEGHNIIFLADKSWHPGVVGIIAGRIKERFNRPTLIGTITEDQHIKGSGRSVSGIDLGSAIIAAKHKNIIQSGGGHAMAGGFSLTVEQADKFYQFLEERLKEAEQLPCAPDLLIDTILSPQGANYECAQELETLAPFGPGNPEPIIVIPHIHVAFAQRVGRDQNTLRLSIKTPNKGYLNALLFKIDSSPLRPLLEDKTKPAIHLAGQLRGEIWNNQKRCTFFIKDAALAG